MKKIYIYIKNIGYEEQGLMSIRGFHVSIATGWGLLLLWVQYVPSNLG
jgi:hypothetical protein